MVKLRRITLYRIMPIILISVLLFSICLCSNVFSPRPARAIVGEEFILPAFYGWLNASNVFINTYNSDASDTQYLANGVAQTLLDVANAIAFLNVSTWTRSSLLSELASRTDLVPNDVDLFYFKFDEDTSTLFDSATRQFIIDHSLSSDTSTPVTINTTTGYFFANGVEFLYSDNSYNGGTLIAGNTVYESINGTKFELVLTQANQMKIIDPDDNSVYVTHSINANWNDVTGLRVSSKASGSTSLWCRYYGLNTSDIASSSTTAISKQALSDMFGGSETVGYNATTGTIVQNPDIPDSTEDEYGYVGIPAGVGAGTASTGLELLQSMLDYERDKPYSSTSEYTYTISNEVPIQPEPEEPGMVELPLIGIQLPTNFSLNLRGIWYYVVQWVNSIRAFMSWMFGVFANLPYAMIVPIYASAVVVIVLGVYKRFFM